MIREFIANSLITAGRVIGEYTGLKLAVIQSDHSIETKMEHPDKDKRAWDSNMFRNANLFLAGYANPIKNRIQQNEGLENPNTVDVEETDVEQDGDVSEQAEEDNSLQAAVIASSRYKDYMRQDLISQLLTPESRWNIIVWGLIGLGVLVFMNIIVVLYATGSF